MHSPGKKQIIMVYTLTAVMIFGMIVGIEYALGWQELGDGPNQQVFFSLPPQGDHITSGLEIMKKPIIWGDIVLLSGWAYAERQSSQGNTIYVVLKSKKKTYIFKTIPGKRPDVTADRGYSQSLNLDDSGFLARISLKEVEKDDYRIGLLIKSPHGDAWSILPPYITKKWWLMI